MRRICLAISAVCLLGVAKPGLAQPVSERLALDHVGIQAVDLERSVTFYTQVLGLKEVPSPFPKTAARWFDLGDGRRLHIVAGGVATAEHNRWDHFALSCHDIAKVEADLDRLGIRWTGMSGARDRHPPGWDPADFHPRSGRLCDRDQRRSAGALKASSNVGDGCASVAP